MVYEVFFPLIGSLHLLVAVTFSELCVTSSSNQQVGSCNSTFVCSYIIFVADAADIVSGVKIVTRVYTCIRVHVYTCIHVYTRVYILPHFTSYIYI